MRGAHPSDGWQVDANVEEGIESKKPKTMEERLDITRTYYSNLGLSFPAMVDSMDNKVEEVYAAWPGRLYISALYSGQEGKDRLQE